MALLMKSTVPTGIYSVIADEASDVTGSEKLSVTLMGKQKLAMRFMKTHWV